MRNDEIINRSLILKALISLNIEDLKENFDTITTPGKNPWFISFKHDFKYKQIVGKSVKINEHDVLSDHLIEKHLISEGISKLEIEDIYDAFLNDPDFKHVKSGTIRAKLKFNALQNTKYLELVNKLPKNTYIQNSPFQFKGEVLKRNKCNGRGHLSSTFNLAKRIAKPNDDHIFDDGELNTTEENEGDLFDNFIRPNENYQFPGQNFLTNIPTSNSNKPKQNYNSQAPAQFNFSTNW
ncbi:unnamed protein product [Brachionus calyciflorus]|uniref:Uncharacterized protein n=1 Tax=Brachionus calyciflorus TaxID=104777 RepID=A0A813WVG3_9BILA|nr:unnamed protein product [Brachionus calyciflorus]